MSRLLAPAFLLLLVALAVLRLRGGEPTPVQTAAAAEQPRYTLRGVDWLRYDEQGRREFEGHADTVDYFDDESARLSTFEVSLVEGRGAPWVARAPQGQVPAGDRRLQLLGGVKGEGRWPDGEKLSFSTPDIWVDSANDRLDTESEVEIQSASRSAHARGMKVDGAKQQLQLLNDVKIRYATP